MARKKKEPLQPTASEISVSEVVQEPVVNVDTDDKRKKDAVTVSEARSLYNKEDVPASAVQISRDEYVKMQHHGVPVAVVTGPPKAYFMLKPLK